MTVLPVANHSDTIDLRLGNQIILMYLLGVLERNRKHRWIPLSVPVDLNTTLGNMSKNRDFVETDSDQQRRLVAKYGNI